jgi:membrane protein DedA with SNARE-associated domain
MLERLVPAIPSYGLLVAIGIGAADGSWSVPGAVAASIGCGMAGCLLFYIAGRCLGERRSLGLLRRGAVLFGLSAARVDHLAAGFRRHQGWLSFGAQLVPTAPSPSPASPALPCGTACSSRSGSRPRAWTMAPTPPRLR